MKTPREILMGQHQAASSKLDALRAKVLAEISNARAPQSNWWREWLWPCPQAWAGLAAAWLLILAMTLAAGKSPFHPAAATVSFSRQELIEWKQQQQMLAKLISPIETTANGTGQATIFGPQ